MSVEKIKKKILPILKSHGVKRAALFGSAARGRMKPTSDIDVLVEIKKNISLIDFIGIKNELEDALGRAVDLVEYDALKPRLKEQVLRDRVTIL